MRELARSAAVVLAVTMLAAACATTLDIRVDPGDGSGPTDPAEAGGDGDGGDGGSGDPEPVAAGDLAGRSSWDEAACEFTAPEDVTTTCGWLTVPERWDLDNDEDTIRLHVGIFSTGAAGTPVVYLEGGPGGDALANIDTGFATLFGPISEAHDVVVVGQRGTGSAEPHLQCTQANEVELDLLDESPTPVEEAAAYDQAYAACTADFRAQGVDLAAYNSVQSANDVEALRQALGHDRWNLLGISYGTRLAQSIMRLHPDGLRSVILDSALPTEREAPVDIPTVAQRAYDELFAGCAASTVCSGSFPDLEQRFFALVDQLDASPVDFMVSDSITGQQYPARLDGTDLLGVGFQALYSREALAGLPELVAQLEVGDTTGAETLVGLQVTSMPFVASGMYWAVECHEEVPFIQPGDADAGRTGDPYYDRFAPAEIDSSLTDLCAHFDAGAAEPAEDELVRSDVPVLLLAGSYDPITPPSDTESLLEGLPNATFVELPHTGHGAVVDPCGQQLAVAFLADPSAAVDTSCVSGLTEPPWVIDLFADIEFESFSYDSVFVSGSGVAPVGWEPGAEGSFVNSDNLLHLSVILQQAVAGVPAEFLVESLSLVLGTDPVELGPVDVGGVAWGHWEATIPGSIVDMFVLDDDGTTLLVLFQHAPADRGRALDVLTTPILSAFTS